MHQHASARQERRQTEEQNDGGDVQAPMSSDPLVIAGFEMMTLLLKILKHVQTLPVLNELAF
jgi:hypothetical protein